MKIEGITDAYKESLKTEDGENMELPRKLVFEMATGILTLKDAVIDLKAALRTCANSSNGALEQYKDL